MGCISSKESDPEAARATIVSNTSEPTAKDDNDEPNDEPVKKNLSRYLQQNHDAIFASNRKWIEARLEEDATFFVKLSSSQHPDYL
jgi:carbonic anhydrase